ncbi:transmembrane protein 252 [Astyanax mexicanus]|uniref:transmembrane protein 252 n=1 Tax=Astyanax mexicanus TaxID=7994 RepID=UPI0020CB1CC5|nr:transmembrane protein 252 [Astyanax mexicanus]
MKLRKPLLAAVRLVLPTAGLGLICGGAYVNSLGGGDLLREIFTYLLIILGFVLLVGGVLWSLGHGVKGVLVKWSGGRMRHTDVQVFTVDRMNFPPSYEESQIRTEAAEGTGPVPAVPLWPGLAPPIYTQTSFETLTEDYSHEAPPTYEQAIRQNQIQNQSLNQNQAAPTDQQDILQNQNLNQVSPQTITSLQSNIFIEPF